MVQVCRIEDQADPARAAEGLASFDNIVVMGMGEPLANYDALLAALRILNARLGDVAFNLVVHTAPHQYHGGYHWHVHLFPKLTTTAGFERGTGVMINIVSPEEAAHELRSASSAFA